MLITLTQLKKSLQALKDFLLAKIPLKTSDLTNDSGYITADDAVQDVQINGTSIVDDGVANVPVATNNISGVVKVATSYGIRMENGILRIDEATSGTTKQGVDPDHPVVSKNQHEAVFYGLAKIAGHDEKDSTLAVGTYTEEAKTAIKSMLGVEDPVDVQINGTSIVNDGVANIPLAGANTIGVVKINSGYGININNNNGGYLYLNPANDAELKAGSAAYKAVAPNKQHAAAFYGLAKAAGDTTQSASSNAVGTYTDEAKSAIKTMLGIDTITVDSIPTTEIDTLFA